LILWAVALGVKAVGFFPGIIALTENMLDGLLSDNDLR
jgi:hypothetical protein